MLGTLFVNKEIPEAPKLSFFKGLFTSGPSMLDREELCKYPHYIDLLDLILFPWYDPQSYVV